VGSSSDFLKYLQEAGQALATFWPMLVAIAGWLWKLRRDPTAPLPWLWIGATIVALWYLYMPIPVEVAGEPDSAAQNDPAGTGCPLWREPRELPFTTLQRSLPSDSGRYARVDALYVDRGEFRWMMAADPTGKSAAPATSFVKLLICPHWLIANSQIAIIDRAPDKTNEAVREAANVATLRASLGLLRRLL
jgi:hypothetical protein